MGQETPCHCAKSPTTASCGIKPITEKDSTPWAGPKDRQRHTSDESSLRYHRKRMENVSREYTQIRAMVGQQQKHGWVSSWANTLDTAGRMGIRPDRTANYHADGVGTQVNFVAVSEAVSEIRSKRFISQDWKAGIDADYKGRKGKKE